MRRLSFPLVLLATCAGAPGGQPAVERSFLRNGTFDRDIAGWSAWYAPGQSAGGARWVAREGGGAMHVAVTRRDRPSAVQVYQGPFRVRKGAWYAVSFEAKAEKPTPLGISMIRHSAPYGGLGLRAELSLDAAWRTYGLLARATADSGNARIDFFPAATFWLDNVAIAELGAEPPTWPVRSVTLGRGWRGQGRAVADGNPRSVLASGYYPDLPLLLTLDLGEPKPVGALLVQAEDRGRHTYVGRIAVDVSDDGRRWFRWAKASRTSWGAPTRRQPMHFAATGLAVAARYLRLRVERLRGVAVLADTAVVRSPAGTGAAVRTLPPADPASNLAFQGWDYDRLGYALSPGERPALRFTNQSRDVIDLRLNWRVVSYFGWKPIASLGGPIARGASRLRVAPLGVCDVPIALDVPLEDGPHRLRFRLGDQTTEQALYFDHRVAQEDDALTLSVAALLDCVDPEGWIKLVAGPAAPYIDVRRAIPDDAKQIDAALVTAERWDADAKQVKALKRYLAAGGKVMFFGKVGRVLDELLPVAINGERPWLDGPLRLGPPPFWRGQASERLIPQVGVRVAAKPGSRVLCRWEDGSPAVVEGAVGPGRTLYLGTPPGRTWCRRPEFKGADELTLHCLYYLAGRSNGPPTLLNVVGRKANLRRRLLDRALRRAGAHASPGLRLGCSEHNVGRFGWAVAEGGLVENLAADGAMRCPSEATPWRVTEPGRGPLTGTVAYPNWFVTSLGLRDARGGVISPFVSLGSPCILWQGGAGEVHISSDATHVAFATTRGATVRARGQRIEASLPSEGWLVLFRADAKARDCPRIVVLERRPTAIRFRKALELEFEVVEHPAPMQSNGVGSLWTGRLFGLRRLAPGATARWVEAFPIACAAQAAMLERHCLAFPNGCTETYERDGNGVRVVNTFSCMAFPSEWGTRPEPLVPLPPVLSLARRYGFPVRVDANVRDAGIATKYGPLEVAGRGPISYRLPLPPRDHFGVIPVEGQTMLRQSIDRRGVQGISTVKRSSGGLTTGDAFLADLRAYMGAGQFPPFEAPHLDLYKWWYCFPTVCGRPAYGPEARKAVDEHHRVHYWKTLNFYPHKSLIRYRREPWTGLDYACSFIWPVSFRDGVRYFVDQNESASVILYCLWAYANYYGDWATARSNWNLCQYVHRYLTRFHDWATMASSNQEFFSTVGIDMLNSEYPGNLAYARIARQVGDEQAEALGLYLAAKAMVPTIARFYMPDYVKSITAPGDPWREWKYYWSFHENGIKGEKSLIQRGNADFIAAIAGGFLDTSKGTSPEIALLYKRFVPDRIAAYERDVQALEREHGVAPGFAHSMMRAILGWPRGPLIAGCTRFDAERPNWGWQSTKAPHNLAIVDAIATPLFLAEWAPAEYVAGRYTPDDRTVRLTLHSREAGAYSARLYSQRAPADVRLNDEPFGDFTYDPKTGWLALRLAGPGAARLTIRLAEKPTAPLHPYFAPSRLPPEGPKAENP